MGHMGSPSRFLPYFFLLLPLPSYGIVLSWDDGFHMFLLYTGIIIVCPFWGLLTYNTCLLLPVVDLVSLMPYISPTDKLWWLCYRRVW